MIGAPGEGSWELPGEVSFWFLARARELESRNNPRTLGFYMLLFRIY